MTWYIELIFILTNSVFLFYGFSFCHNKLDRTSVKTSIVGIGRYVCVVVGFLTIRYFVRYWFLANYVDSEFADQDFSAWFTHGTIWIVNYFFYALAYFHMRDSLLKQEKIANLREQQLINDKKLLQMENTVLRSQINPHVLYNTLNFLYAKSLPVSEELSNGILTLSEIMQYSLKSQDSNGLVPLVEELEHVQNVIALAQLKSNGKAHINLRYDEFDESIMVVPLVLITLVENIFKHGDVSDPNQPAVISLKKDIESDRIIFMASNKVGKTNQMPGTQLGLGNVRIRLENEYGIEGKMKVTRSESLFQVEISIPFRTSPTVKKQESFATSNAA